ncbi:conjugal transfer protein TraF [Vibrio sp. 10N.261.46.E12]|uniref:conjugal transfer protein TraF n=1 Tax=unclassified Vibrio TaxID=2614977 RepID=UPI000976EA83|nr:MULTISPECIES: conjugal transfer protein TraF [unclassified Vibrio]OMO35721.1 hypothetical protein BH584_07450 [Vibrio sp. 10N.261.45.E1]PMJ22881.1 hypothetical protein BCU27_15980 [Vibrio sp. 10N.286.45.B6]PML87218.1 hypothetical protein BCT66_12570 [Vibrio sp. 10N.261.49.E11]PMM67522.1 hypothetical protein BCT48_14545 [Vibrio sp. 10N.261.46.F12]PMM86717.1 hypothetical protein BCT46_07665 [Vibrio sp. 10N.261.46.E8]
MKPIHKLFILMLALLSVMAHGATAKETFQQVMVKGLSSIPSSTVKTEHSSNEWDLVFVFADWCAYCHRTAPVINAWAKENNVQIRAISTTGIGLPDYPHPELLSHLDKSRWFQGNIRVPALLAQHREDPTRIQGIASGAVTYAQLTALWQQTLLRLQPLGNEQ